MSKFLNGVVAGAVVSAGAMTAINMANTMSHKKKEYTTIVGDTLHKLGDMAEGKKNSR